LGYWWPAGHADILVNSSGESIDTDACARHLRDVSGGVPVTVTACDSETLLLRQMRHTLFHKFERNYNRLLVFNAEVWKGGFDLPFTRTSCVKHGVDRVFAG
jgi:hypothetical protein